MANIENTIRRLKYHDGQLLDVSDFEDEQDYHREMRMRHNRLVHSWGIAQGLEVTIATKKITAGIALDKEGRELCLLAEAPLDLPDLKSTTRYVTAKFVDPDDQSTEVKDTDTGTIYYRRTIERANIEVTPTEPAVDGSVIVLAKLVWNDEGKVADDPSARSRSVSSRIDPAADLAVGRLSLQGNKNNKRGALFLGVLGDFNHALYNNASNLDKEGAWDGAKWNVGVGLNIRLGLTTDKQSALFIDDKRNVGIGTTSPGAKLEVANYTLDDTAFQPLIRLLANQKDESPSNAFNETKPSYGIEFLRQWNNTSTEVQAGIYAWGTGKFGSGLAFRTKLPGSRLSTRMVITDLGNIGIGKLDPGAKLEVAVDDANTKPLVVGKGTTNYLTMLNNGNVGIGAASPAAKLEVAIAAANADTKPLVVGKGTTNYLTMLNDGNVGIGTTSPGAKLEVAIAAANADTKPLVVGKGTTNYLTMLNNGNVGIGETSPGPFKLYVKGDVRVEGKVWAEKLVHHWDTRWFTFDDKTTGVYHTDISNQYPSDTRFKTDLRPICNALEKLMQLHGVCYRWGETGLQFLTRDIPNRLSAGPGATEEENHKLWETERRKAYEALSGQNIGLVAQDVETVVPEVVHEDEAGYKYIRYQQLVALVVEAIKEQNALIQALSAKVSG